MRDVFQITRRIPYAAVAGLCGFAGSLFGKLAGSRKHIDYICGAVHALRPGFQNEATDTCKDFENWLVRGVLVVCMVLSNVAVWTFYVKALQSSKSSLPATLISSTTNFILSAVFGALVFAEATSLLWWSGAFMIILGLFLVSEGKDHSTKKES